MLQELQFQLTLTVDKKCVFKALSHFWLNPADTVSQPTIISPWGCFLDQAIYNGVTNGTAVTLNGYLELEVNLFTVILQKWLHYHNFQHTIQLFCCNNLSNKHTSCMFCAIQEWKHPEFCANSTIIISTITKILWPKSK